MAPFDNYSPLAEVFNNYLKKGSKVYVCGKNKTRKWTDKDGVEKYTTEVIIREMQILDSKKDSQQQEQSNQDQQSHGSQEWEGKQVDQEDDIPY